MDKEFIKNELIAEISAITNSDPNTFKTTSGLLDKLEMWQTKLGKTEDFSKTIISKLNDIIEKHNIVFKDEAEKNEIIEFLKPTIQDLIVKNIKR